MSALMFCLFQTRTSFPCRSALLWHKANCSWCSLIQRYTADLWVCIRRIARCTRLWALRTLTLFCPHRHRRRRLLMLLKKTRMRLWVYRYRHFQNKIIRLTQRLIWRSCLHLPCSLTLRLSWPYRAIYRSIQGLWLRSRHRHRSWKEYRLKCSKTQNKCK